MHPSDSVWDRQVREGESGAQRADRNFADLLQELRITLTGSQILFAFLLVAPFSGGFHRVTGFQRGLYVAILLTSALSAGLLVAPAAMHRMIFRQHLKAALVRIAGTLALAGQSLFMIALAEAILLVVGYLYNLAVGAGLAAFLLAGTRPGSSSSPSSCGGDPRLEQARDPTLPRKRPETNDLGASYWRIGPRYHDRPRADTSVTSAGSPGRRGAHHRVPSARSGPNVANIGPRIRGFRTVPAALS